MSRLTILIVENEATVAAVIATDAKGRVTFINPVAEALTGWKAGEAMGRPLVGRFQNRERTDRGPGRGPCRTGTAQIPGCALGEPHRIGEYVREAIERVRRLKPDVVVMDVSMPEMDGIEATRYIKDWWPEVRVIALSMLEDEHVSRTMREAGAESFVSKTASSTELLKAIYGSKQAAKDISLTSKGMGNESL